jgi:PAS domain S-box-containing protein
MQTEGQQGNNGSRNTTDASPNYRLIMPPNRDAPWIEPSHLSPLRLFVIIIGGIFLAEVIAMLVVYVLGPLPYPVLTLIDATVMTVLISPLLYFLSFRPLVRYIQKNQLADAALLRSMELQERFFDSIDTLIAYMDRDFNFIRVNEAYARSDGRQPEFFSGKNHFDLYPHAENQAIFQKVVESGEAYSVHEKPFEHPDQPGRGLTYWNWSLLPVRGVKGDVEGVVLSLVDVTERVRAEEKNRQLSRIVEQTADTVVVTDCDGVIEYVNPAFEQVTGYTREEAQNKTPGMLKSGLHDDQFYRELWKTILGGEVFQSEIANRRKNGELFYEAKTITPLRDERGDITNFVATGKDISDRKQAEEELRKAYDELELRVKERTEELRISNAELEEEIIERKKGEAAIKESEEKYRNLFSNMSEGFAVHEIILDDHGIPCNYRFLEINDAFEEMTGISQEQAVGKTVKEVLPDIEPHWIETYGTVALTGEPVHFESFSVQLGRWYEVYCYSPRRSQFAVVFFDFSERKLAEEQLRYQAALLSNVNDAIVASDAQYRITAWNAAAENLYGWKADEVLGRKGVEIVRTEWFGQDPEEMRRVIAQTGRWRGEATQARKDGTRIPVEISSIVLFDDRGNITDYISANRDITERKRAEKALFESEQRLSRAQEIAHLGSWELDLENNRLTWSDEAYRIFGLQPQEFAATYEAFLEVVHPDDREAVDIAYSNSLRDGSDGYEIEHRLVKRASGEIRIIHEKCEHFRDESGRITRSAGMVHDITERKQVEAALRAAHDELELRVRERTKELAVANRELLEEIAERKEAERQLRIQTTAMEAAAYGILITDPKGEILWMNPALTRMTGYTEDELVGHNMRVFKSGQHSEDYYQEMWATILAGGVWQGETTNRRKNGELYTEEQTITPVRDENGQISHFIAIKQDITEHKRIEKALELERIRLNRILETIPDGVYIVNQRFEVEYANPVVEREFGAIKGQKCYTYFHGLAEPCPWCKNEEVFAGGPFKGERTYLRNNKSYEIFDAPLVNSDGTVSKLKLLHDITQRKKMELDLEQSNRDLQAASEAERKQRQFAEALVAAALVLNKSLELDEVLTVILEQIKLAIPYQFADIGLLDGDAFYDASHQGEGDIPAAQMGLMNRYLLGDFPLLKKMCQSGQPVLIPDTDREPDWKSIDRFEWCHSFLSAALIVEGQVIGFVNLFARQTDYFTIEMRDRLVAFASHAAAAIQNAWLFEQVRSSSERLQSLSRRLVEVQENERLFIARELHDEAGQVLTSLLVDLRLMEKEASRPEAILNLIDNMESSLNNVIENLHRVAMALRPASLDHVGLVAALRQHVEALSEKHGLKINFNFKTFKERLPPNVETVLYRIVQESLTNVLRYAHASQVDVILTVRNKKLVVIVEDNGIGFDPEAVLTGEHLGLFGMRERAEMIGGNLVIESAPGKGTTIMVEVDYDVSDLDR